MLSFLGPLLSAGVAGAGIMAQSSAQGDANAINWRSLLETIRQNREREQMAKASRKDAYGNEINYDEYNGWDIDLTPITQSILAGQQREQMKSLNEDAPRNRAAAVRMDERSKEGDEQFNKIFNEYKYRDQPSEEELTADAMDLMLRGRSKGLAEAANGFARQLLRTGNTSNVGKVYKQAGDSYADSLAETLLQAKRQGSQDYNSRQAADLSRFTGELGFLKDIADSTTTSPVANPSYNGELSSRADQALSDLLGVTQQSIGNSQRAYAQAAESFGQSPDFSALASALGRINLEGGKTTGPAAAGTGLSGLPGVKYDAQGNPIDPWAGMRQMTL